MTIRRWTAEEDRLIAVLPLDEAARATGRTIDAINKRRSRQKIDPRRRLNHAPPTPCEICGESSIARRKCRRHYAAWMRWGRRSPSRWAKAVAGGAAIQCGNCGKSFVGLLGCDRRCPACCLYRGGIVQIVVSMRPKMLRAVRRRAKEKSISVAAMIRECVRDALRGE